MTASKKRDGDSEGESGFVTPDSTTKEKILRFAEGEEVLSHSKDGLYYFGKIVAVNDDSERCLIRFEDETAHWSLFKDLRKLQIPASDDLCNVCHSSTSFNGNEIVFCSVCDKGYHQNCLEPHVGDEFCLEESQWECPKCRLCSPAVKETAQLQRKNVTRKKRRQTDCTDPGTDVLPYDLSSLTWDLGHKLNEEHTYCYCGGPGEWYNKMIQCYKCSQWFHEFCLDTHVTLLYGDRSFVFVCKFCHKGSEFLYRLDVDWREVVHLAIFNLNLTGKDTVFDYETTITPWITDNWEALQCPLELQNVQVGDRTREVIRCLVSDRQNFQTSRHGRRKNHFWSLRSNVPPPAKELTIVPEVPFTYDKIKNTPVTYATSKCTPSIKRTLRRQPEDSDDRFQLNRLTPAKKHPFDPNCDSSPQNPDECPNRRKRKREIDRLTEDPKAKKMIREVYGRNGIDAVIPTKRRGRPPKNRLRQKEIVKIVRPRKDRSCKDPFISYGPTKDVKVEKESTSSILGLGPANRPDSSGDDSSSRGTLESFIPPPTNFEGLNNPFLSMYPKPPSTKLLNKRLSENDIKIGKNGEVKRRRVRRKVKKDQCYNGSIRNCVDYALTARIKNDNDSQNRPDGEISLSELQSEVNSYFKESTRMDNSKKFSTIGRRVNLDHSIEYLVEWDAS